MNENNKKLDTWIEKILKVIYKKTVKRIFPSAGDIVEKFLIDEMKDCARILDLGCGPCSPLGRIKDKLRADLYSVGVDDFDLYLEKTIESKIHSRYIKNNILSIDFPNNSFDCTILLDVIEHFEREDFLNFLPKLEKISRKIIIMTPNGFTNQDGYDDNKYQVHKSGWTAEDMRHLGFKCFGVSGLKQLRGELALPKIKPAILGNLISNITEPLVYNNPEKAYHLICVKKNYV